MDLWQPCKSKIHLTANKTMIPSYLRHFARVIIQSVEERNYSDCWPVAIENFLGLWGPLKSNEVWKEAIAIGLGQPGTDRGTDGIIRQIR